MSIFERIEALRKEKGLSQKDLEKALGFSNGSVSKWRTSSPKPERLQKLADFFGVTVDYLVTGAKTEKVPTPKNVRQVNDDDIKFALFGGNGDITDEMYEEVKAFAKFVQKREQEKRG